MEPRAADIAALRTALREGHLTAAQVGDLLSEHPDLRRGHGVGRRGRAGPRLLVG